MNPIKTAMLALGALIVAAAPANAGSIDYLSNQSGQFIGNFARNASTYGADTAAYNPAGTAWLTEKLYLNLSIQTVFKEFKATYKGKDYASSVPTPAVPSLFIVYKPLDELSIFASFTVPAGGGSLAYDDGVPFLEALALTVQPGIQDTNGNGVKDEFTPSGGFFNGSSMYLAPTLGVAYRFFDMFSVSAAARLVISSRTFEGSASYGGGIKGELDATKSAIGVGGIFGLHFRPHEALDIGVRFETPTSLNFETSSNLKYVDADGKAVMCTSPGQANCNSLSTIDNAVSSFAHGATEKRNLPMILAVGVAGRPIPELTLSASINYYFVKDADEIADATGVTGYAKGYDDDYDNGFDLAGSASYRIIDEFELTLSYNRSIVGGNKDTYNDFEYALDSHAFGLGMRLTAHKQVDVNLGFSYTMYDQGSNDTMNATLETFAPLFGLDPVEGETFDKWVFAIGLGVEWRPDI